MFNKKIIFTLIFAIFLLLFGTHVFAYTVEDVDYLGNSINFPDIDDSIDLTNGFYISMKNPTNPIYRLYVFNPNTFLYTETNGNDTYLKISGGYILYEWTGFISTFPTSGTIKYNTYVDEFIDNGGYKFHFATTVYTDINKSDVFFQLPPQVVEEEITLEGVLAPIMVQQEMRLIMQEIVELLPVILNVLVSLLAFYKCLAILYHFLVTS